MRLQNRTDAGRQLAARLDRYARRPEAIVLGLPRGGVVVAAEVAARLSLPLDVFLVRKLGVPGHPEYAMGAIAEGGIVVLSDVVRQLAIPERAVQSVKASEQSELARRQRLYRDDRPTPVLDHRVVILVDDGLATGSTMEAAVMALRERRPERIIATAPVGAPDACARIGRLADEVVCVATPDPFSAVGLWYDDFREVSDEEVNALLAAGASSHVPSGTVAP
jgi:putative phosphoribosyl transferase